MGESWFVFLLMVFFAVLWFGLFMCLSDREQPEGMKGLKSITFGTSGGSQGLAVLANTNLVSKNDSPPQ